MIIWILSGLLAVAFVLIGLLFYRQRNVITLHKEGNLITLSDKNETVKIERVEL